MKRPKKAALSACAKTEAALIAAGALVLTFCSQINLAHRNVPSVDPTVTSCVGITTTLPINEATQATQNLPDTARSIAPPSAFAKPQQLHSPQVSMSREKTSGAAILKAQIRHRRCTISWLVASRHHSRWPRHAPLAFREATARFKTRSVGHPRSSIYLIRARRACLMIRIPGSGPDGEVGLSLSPIDLVTSLCQAVCFHLHCVRAGWIDQPINQARRLKSNSSNCAPGSATRRPR